MMQIYTFCVTDIVTSIMLLLYMEYWYVLINIIYSDCCDHIIFYFLYFNSHLGAMEEYQDYKIYEFTNRWLLGCA